MLAFIILVFVFGTISIIYVLFPLSSFAKGFRILKHMYITKKTKKKYKKNLENI